MSFSWAFFLQFVCVSFWFLWQLFLWSFACSLPVLCLVLLFPVMILFPFCFQCGYCVTWSSRDMNTLHEWSVYHQKTFIRKREACQLTLLLSSFCWWIMVRVSPFSPHLSFIFDLSILDSFARVISILFDEVRMFSHPDGVSHDASLVWLIKLLCK